MIENVSDWIVDMRYKPMNDTVEIFIGKRERRHEIAVMQPIIPTFKLQDTGEKIEPSFEISTMGWSEAKNFLTAVVSAINEKYPEILEKYKTQSNKDELERLEKHIANLNSIINKCFGKWTQ